MTDETTQDSDIESEFDWDKLDAQAAEIDNINLPSSEVKETEPEPEVSSGELVAQAIQVTADLIAPNWQIQPQESEKLGVVYGALLDKYMPDSGIDKFGLEISALLVTGMIIKSRSGIPLRKPKPKDDEKSAIEQQAPVTSEQVVHEQVAASATLEAKAVKHD